MTWYIYADDGEQVATVYAPTLTDAQREAAYIGYGGYAIERA